MTTISLKRAYEPYAKSDGFRILVDRLWPRGLKKSTAHIDAWMKEISPSPELRMWFNHDPARWAVFTKAYTAELRKSAVVDELLACFKKHKKITLLYAARDEEHNHALVLQRSINRSLKKIASGKKAPPLIKSPKK